jgi:hypothetical protein
MVFAVPYRYKYRPKNLYHLKQFASVRESLQIFQKKFEPRVVKVKIFNHIFIIENQEEIHILCKHRQIEENCYLCVVSEESNTGGHDKKTWMVCSTYYIL